MKTNLKVPAIIAAIAVFAIALYAAPIVAPVNALSVNEQNDAVCAAPVENPIVLSNDNQINEEVHGVEIAVDTTEPAEDETISFEENNVEVEIPDTAEPVGAEPEATEPPATEPPATEPPVYQEDEYHEEGCNHFWRQEYQPETETEDGRIYESCLYCGEYRLIQVIPAYGSNN
jgi:hypothetical protein